MIVMDKPDISVDRILKEQGFHIITEKEYKEYMRLKNNEAYLAKIKKGIEQIKAGQGQEHELI